MYLLASWRQAHHTHMNDVTHSGEADDTESTPLVLMGLDGEMSSADIGEGGKLIQAGAATWVNDPGGPIEVFSSLIRHDRMAWSERAAAVHGLTRDEFGSKVR